jgi:hypothetical protein
VSSHSTRWRRAGHLSSGDQFAEMLWEAVEDHAEGILTLPLMPEPTPGPSGILVQVRQEVDRIYSTALTYILTGNETFAERCKEELLLLTTNWTTWNPPHFLDVAEAMHGVSVGYDALYDYLTEEERVLIEDGIATFGLQQYILGVVNQSQWWYSTVWNWGGVCNGGAIVAALALADVPRYAALANQTYALALAQGGIFQSLTSYAPQGAWPEGPTYEDYMARLLIAADASLTSATGSDQGIAATSGLDETCLFTIYSDSNALASVFNWADSEEASGPHANLLYLATKYNVPACAQFARMQAVTTSDDDPTLRLRRPLSISSYPDPASPPTKPLRTSNNILSRQLLWYTTMGSIADIEALPIDKLYEAKYLAFFRSDWNFSDYAHATESFLGFKGGNNAWNHGHLDQGSFVFDWSAKRIALDLGADNYGLPGYFEPPQRWQYYRLGSLGHNVLLFGNENQNATAVSPIVTFNSTNDPLQGGWAVADLTQAYAGSGGVATVQRGVALTLARQQLIVRDEISFSAASPAAANVSWQMHTYLNATIISPTAIQLFAAIGARQIVAYATVVANSTSCPGLQAAVVPVNLQPPQYPTTGVTRIQFVTSSTRTCTSITVAVGPTPPTSTALNVRPLALWGSTGPLVPPA